MFGRVKKALAGRLPLIQARAKVHARERRVEQLKRRARHRKRRVGNLKQRVSRFDHRVRKLEAELESLKPARAESIVWIFGSGRSGTSWLANMVSEALEAPLWFEPRLGDVFHAKIPKNKGWLPGVRRFVLEGARHRFGKPERLVIKETSGCIGAPILSEALPWSRLLVIVRDPRDVVASWLDAKRKEGWSTTYKRVVRKGDPDSLAIFLAIL